MNNISGIVIAGGISRRLGQDKRKLLLWGEDGPTLLEHTLGVIAPFCDDLLVVLNDPENWLHLPATLVTDVYPDAGSLGGIYTGLDAAQAPYALVVAADMPLLSSTLLAAMLERPRSYDALVPRSPEPGKARNALNVEPLHAVYSRACLEPLRATLDAGKRRIIDLLALVQVEVIEPDELRRYDAHGHAFLNINTTDDLALAQSLINKNGFPMPY